MDHLTTLLSNWRIMNLFREGGLTMRSLGCPGQQAAVVVNLPY